uniref:PHD-type domain-containing protein n=1 Tax=Seriola lalandi dorsalis TaxID=1841481 RepID=A0A3B4YAH7_SERLL
MQRWRRVLVDGGRRFIPDPPSVSGEKCILCEKQWFTPTEFEKLAGKSSSKNWKWSIRCSGTPLGKLIKVWLKSHLNVRIHVDHCTHTVCGGKSFLFIFHFRKATWSQEATKESIKRYQDKFIERRPEGSKTVFKVTCGGVAGTLHQKRFGSGTCGKSIRTETRWLSPVEFVKEASSLPDASWKKDIEVDGRPLSFQTVLLYVNRITVMDCVSWQENQKNDDECYVCKSEEAAELVVCDHCPRAFHQRCHLPQVDDATLSSLWMCTFCVFRTNHKCRYSDKMEMKSAMLRNISQHMLVSSRPSSGLSLCHTAVTHPFSHINRNVSIFSCFCTVLMRNKILL